MLYFLSGQLSEAPAQLYEWSEMAFVKVNGYAVIEAVNASHLYWEWINSANDQVQDRMVLIQRGAFQINEEDFAAPSQERKITPTTVARIIFVIFMAVGYFTWSCAKLQFSKRIRTGDASEIDRADEEGLMLT
jgi:hypothetical protein